jgi:hypothetical protein
MRTFGKHCLNQEEGKHTRFKSGTISQTFFVKGPAADAADAPQP